MIDVIANEQCRSSRIFDSACRASDSARIRFEAVVSECVPETNVAETAVSTTSIKRHRHDQLDQREACFGAHARRRSRQTLDHASFIGIKHALLSMPEKVATFARIRCKPAKRVIRTTAPRPLLLEVTQNSDYSPSGRDDLLIKLRQSLTLRRLASERGQIAGARADRTAGADDLGRRNGPADDVEPEQLEQRAARRTGIHRWRGRARRRCQLGREQRRRRARRPSTRPRAGRRPSRATTSPGLRRRSRADNGRSRRPRSRRTATQRACCRNNSSPRLCRERPRPSGATAS